MDIDIKFFEFSSFFFTIVFMFFLICFLGSFDKEQVKESYKRGGVVYLVFIAKWSKVTKKYSILTFLALLMVGLIIGVYKYLKI